METGVVKKGKGEKKAPAGKSTRSARIDLRMTVEQRELMVAAATARGLSITSFLLTVALDRAHHIIREETVTSLSLRDWKKVRRMIDNPAPPNKALREAMAEYEEVVRSNG